MNVNPLRDALKSWLPIGRWSSTDAEVSCETFSSTDLASGPRPFNFALSTRWLRPQESKKTLIHVAGSWLHAQECLGVEDPTIGEDELGQIQWEVWSASCCLQPMPDILLATVRADGEQEVPVGVLCGNRNYAANYFFVSNLALHPALRPTYGSRLWSDESGFTVCESLIESAIDLSHQMGAHGWLAASPQEHEEATWALLKFHRHDDMTFRRMGYFVV